MRKKVGVCKLGTDCMKWDIFGYQVGVTYKGDGYYRTGIGAFLSVLMFIVVLTYGTV